MTRTLSGTSLHSTQLVRSVARMDGARLSAAPADIAQALSQWITFVDANNLSAVLSTGSADATLTAKRVQVLATCRDVAELRSALESAIVSSVKNSPAGARLSLPVPGPQDSVEVAASYAPYRRYHQGHQQNMELKVRQLRAEVRERVSQVSPALKKLAQLDSTYEGVLDELEASRLAHIPVFLEKRFKQLLGEHQESLGTQQEADSVKSWLRPDGWLTRFHHELQSMLLAELDLRLQTTVGLIEACEQHQTLSL